MKKTPATINNERLSAYLDGELSREEAKEFEQLTLRPELQRSLEQLKLISTQLQTDERDEAVAWRIKQALRANKPARRSRLRRALPLAAAATLVLALFVLPQIKPQQMVTPNDLYEQYQEAFADFG